MFVIFLCRLQDDKKRKAARAELQKYRDARDMGVLKLNAKPQPDHLRVAPMPADANRRGSKRRLSKVSLAAWMEVESEA